MLPCIFGSQITRTHAYDEYEYVVGCDFGQNNLSSIVIAEEYTRSMLRRIDALTLDILRNIYIYIERAFECNLSA